MAETPEARWQRLERQAARDRKRRADGCCPVPGCGPWVTTPNVFRLSVDWRRPELGQIDTYCLPEVRDASAEGRSGGAVAGS
jgi:hypothetical protein